MGKENRKGGAVLYKLHDPNADATAESDNLVPPHFEELKNPKLREAERQYRMELQKK